MFTNDKKYEQMKKEYKDKFGKEYTYEEVRYLTLYEIDKKDIRKIENI